MGMGSFVGGGLGFVFGGPIGAVVGAVLGSFLAGGGSNPFALKENRLKVFGSLFAIAGKLSKADGAVSSHEIRVVDQFIRESLNFDDEQRNFAINVFNKAKDDATPVEEYLRQFGQMSLGEPQLSESVFSFLVALALSDGNLHPKEQEILESAQRIWQLPAGFLEHLLGQYGWRENARVRDVEKAYAILGIHSNASDEEVKRAHRQKALEFHPDKAKAKGVPEELLKFSVDQFNEVQGAYEMVKVSRGM